MRRIYRDFCYLIGREAGYAFMYANNGRYNVDRIFRNNRNVLGLYAVDWSCSKRRHHQEISVRQLRAFGTKLSTVGIMLALHAPIANAQLQLYLNDGVDQGCGAYREDTSTPIVQDICRVSSVAEMRQLGVATGSMVVNIFGTYLNGGLAIGGSFDVGANKIRSLQAGTLATDAVNLGQLMPMVNALGGGAGLDAATGTVTAPSFELANGGRRGTVGDALNDLDGAVTINRGGIAALQKLVSQNESNGKITIGGTLGGDMVDLSSRSEGRTQTRLLSGLSEGAVSRISTDAVTGAQLYATNRNVTLNADNISMLQTQLNQGGVGLVQQDAVTQAITVASHTGGDRITLAGTDGSRALGGLSSGTDDNDAVNVAQLKAVGLVSPEGQALAALVYDDLALGSATLGGSAGTVIRNLADGAVVAGSLEAVNGGQLYEVQRKSADGIEWLSGRVDTLYLRMDAYHSLPVEKPGGIGGDGKPMVPSGTGPDSTAVGDGASATGNDSTAVGAGAVASATDSTALGAHSTASGNGSVALGANSVADRDHTISAGSPGNERQITNVAAGTARTDASNWGQVQDAVAEVQRWVRDRFKQANRLANAGTAAALAMANVPQAYAPNQSAVGAGIGSFKGESALAVGMSTITPGGRWVVKSSLTGNTQGDVGVGMGAAMVW